MRAVRWATTDWLSFFGFAADELRERTFGETIQGPATEKERASRLAYVAEVGMCARVELTNYTKAGVPVVNEILVEPLVNSHGQVCLYKVRTISVRPVGGKPTATAAADATTGATASATAVTNGRNSLVVAPSPRPALVAA